MSEVIAEDGCGSICAGNSGLHCCTMTVELDEEVANFEPSGEIASLLMKVPASL